MAHHPVLGVGWLLMDTVMLVQKYPPEDVKVQALRTLDQVGGPVPRALSVVASMGIPAALAAVVGPDRAGADCIDTLAMRGCDPGHVVRSSTGSTRRSHVWVSAETGSRTIAYSDERLLEPLEVGDDLKTAVATAAVLHLDGRELDSAIELAEVAVGSRVPVVVDAGGWKQGLERLLSSASLLIASRPVLEERGPEDYLATAEAIRKACPRLSAILVTDGARGTSIVADDGITHVSAVSTEVVDTNGAGDAFCGGVLAGLVLKRSLVEAVRLGTGVAASVVASFGDSFPTPQEADDLGRNAAVSER